MDRETSDEPTGVRAALWKLLVFQVKLAADALRDLFLSPLSVLLVVLDLLQRNAAAESNFSRLMAFGRRSDHFINLFDHVEAQDDETLDKVVERTADALKGSPSDRG